MKRIVSIQDISCVGKCSLTVALPIISSMGVEAAVLPTAVLSTHTAISGFTFHDLTEEIPLIASHWKERKYSFDAIYSGYLGSFEQLRLCSEFIEAFRFSGTDSDGLPKRSCVFVDPVLGDHGKFYAGFTPEFAREMGKYCGNADVIVPNMTEAAYLLETDYVPDGAYDEKFVQDILRGLCSLGTKNAVLTGVSFEPEKVGFMGLNAESGTFFSYFTERIPNVFHGTGDIFASTAVGALMNDFSLEESLKIAADYTLECIRESIRDPFSRDYGVNFETAIPWLIRRIGK
ncbi:MAG: pyridoxamine kinase [Thermoguttaceae bacterium]|nr:pyridoxamine kinase [Thermoguttaceae bacterium]